MLGRLIIVGALLVAGAIVNVAVAWGCALRIDGGRTLLTSPVRGHTAQRPPRWNVLMGRTRGALVLRSTASSIPPPPIPLPADASPEEIQAWLSGGLPRPGVQPIVAVPGWSRAATPPEAADTRQRAVWEDARGWPMLSLVSWYEDFGGESDTLWSIDLGSLQGPMGLPRVLPVSPLWLGFAVNSCAYAAAIGLLVFGPLVVVRRLRPGRNLCPTCAYPIGASARCPECGNAVPARID